ncbi:MAG TPA: biotin/lipoyl-containing protein [Candidatus Saccharimonadales bacterium]|nr:biotin/lipoyl-containing protein [Candidatus Saccharimonadales bacterium]
MSDDKDEVLALLDDLLRLAEGSGATAIEVEADGMAAAIVRMPSATPALASIEGRAAAAAPKVAEPSRVHSSGVGIFSASKDWTAGDAVKKGTVLGAVQSLGAMTDVVAPIDGVLRDVLVAGGAPVEYGQALFAIEKR